MHIRQVQEKAGVPVATSTDTVLLTVLSETILAISREFDFK